MTIFLHESVKVYIFKASFPGKKNEKFNGVHICCYIKSAAFIGGKLGEKYFCNWLLEQHKRNARFVNNIM